MIESSGDAFCGFKRKNIRKNMKKKVLYLLKRWRTYIIKHPQVKPHFNGNRLIDRTTLETVGWYVFGLLWLLTAIERKEDLPLITHTSNPHGYPKAYHYLKHR